MHPIGNEPETDPDVLEYLNQMKSSIEESISKLEDEFNQFQQAPNSELGKRRNGTMTQAFTYSPHWDQVIQFIQKDQQEEAIYALVRVVERLLDEKATKKTLSEKANKTYVDGLLDIVSSGIQKNLEASTVESMQTLNQKVAVLHTKIANIRSFLENELRDIEESIQQLTKPNDNEENQEVIEESGGTTFTVRKTYYN